MGLIHYFIVFNGFPGNVAVMTKLGVTPKKGWIIEITGKSLLEIG